MQVQEDKDTMQRFKEDMIGRFWRFKGLRFAAGDPRFEEARPRGLRPPVFHEADAEGNLLLDLALTESERLRLIGMIPVLKRHQWFRSMSSSQALTQTVFGSLAVMGRLDLLAGLETDDGERPFLPDAHGAAHLALEVEVDCLGEPRPTSKDVAYRGLNPVTAECKLMEEGVGACSRPTLDQNDFRYCDGSYTRQKGRQERCSLTEIGVRYWPLVPRLFRIDAGIDHSMCPLHRNYQLVRNLLATCLSSSGEVRADARVVLLHDERNPAFRPGGDGWRAYQQVRSMLIEPRMLERTSWQRLARLLRSDALTTWLADALDAKYGFFESAPGTGGGH
jgi:hypothetical protein